MSRLLPTWSSVTVLLLASAAASAAPDYRAAIEEQQQRLLEAPSAAAWNDLGALLLLADQRAEAGQAFEHALELDADNPAALYNLGVLALDSDPGLSRKLLRSALESVEDGWTHYRLAQAYEALQRERRAVHHYARAFALDRTLLYPDVNPEIITNRLATPSLLRASARTGEVRISPRFVETTRMREMLLDEAVPEAETEPGVEDVVPAIGEAEAEAEAVVPAVENVESAIEETETPRDDADEE